MSKKILLIESDGPFAQELSAALEARGLEARVTGDGKEGLDLARVDRPDAIVLCVELPRMSGYSICNKLKKDEQLKSIPLVIISAEATPETFEQHRKLKTHAEDYLIKPFDGATLLKRLANLVEVPPEPKDASAEEVVTLDDVELEALALEEGAPARAPSDDDDLKLLDEAFESLSTEGGEPPPPPAPAPAATPEEEEEAELLAVEDAAVAPAEIDKLGEEADAALAALGLDEPVDDDLAVTAALLEEEPAIAAPTVAREERAAGPVAAAPSPGGQGLEAEAQRLQDRVAELLIEVARANEALERRGGELSDALARVRALEGDLDQQRAGTRDLEEQAQRRSEEHARGVEDALRSAREEVGRAEERAQRAEAEARAGAERADRAEQGRREAEQVCNESEQAVREAAEREHAALEQRRAAEERADAAEARAAAADDESAGLKLRLEQAEQAASLKAAEAEQARERAEALARELEATRGQVTSHVGDLASLRAELEGVRGELGAGRAELDGVRGDAERRMAELRKRVAELEAQNAKHEERVVKAYQKIKGDEKIRDKARKALAIAQQLLEERAPGAAPAEVQPRRE